jgi:hypothetical protein
MKEQYSLRYNQQRGSTRQERWHQHAVQSTEVREAGMQDSMLRCGTVSYSHKQTQASAALCEGTCHAGFTKAQWGCAMRCAFSNPPELGMARPPTQGQYAYCMSACMAAALCTHSPPDSPGLGHVVGQVQQGYTRQHSRHLRKHKHSTAQHSTAQQLQCYCCCWHYHMAQGST